jgi:hypothetical protein
MVPKAGFEPARVFPTALFFFPNPGESWGYSGSILSDLFLHNLYN